MCCSVLQCVAVCCSVLQGLMQKLSLASPVFLAFIAMVGEKASCSVVQCVEVRSRVLELVVVCFSVLPGLIP